MTEMGLALSSWGSQSSGDNAILRHLWSGKCVCVGCCKSTEGFLEEGGIYDLEDEQEKIGRSAPGRGDSLCKSPELRGSLECSMASIFSGLPAASGKSQNRTDSFIHSTDTA